MYHNFKIAVVIPTYKVKKHILHVVKKIGNEVDIIYVVDDCCPEQSGAFVASHCSDERIRVIYNSKNQGVGGAVIKGYQAALLDGMEIVVKIDGDGQMDPALITNFLSPIIQEEADYTKGNRFFNLEYIHRMPKLRLFGNAVLSFMTKFSSGYWNLFDPTNGYTAIHTNIIRTLPLHKINKRYFFETDMLFRLNLLKAVVVDVPMNAKYDDEISNLKISKIFFEFAARHIQIFLKRIFYNYYLYNFSLASVELPIGLIFLLFGSIYGAIAWIHGMMTHTFTSSGTVMLAALPIIIGMQLLLSCIHYDMIMIPKKIIYTQLTITNKKKSKDLLVKHEN